MNKAKQFFHLLPWSVQKPVIRIYEKNKKIRDYYILHHPIEKKVRKILASMGLCEIKKMARWRIEPIFSQYYSAVYNGQKVFCKVYKKPDFDCIKREERTLTLIREEGSEWIKRHTPNLIKTKYLEDIEIIVTEYIEGKELSKENKAIDSIYNQMMRLLEEQKKLGIVHIDIRPFNFIVKGEDVILIDYGLAFVERFKEEDELYKEMLFPNELLGTGCSLYNIRDGVFDDAYAILKTLKEIEPRFIRKHHDKWMRLNQMIGEEIVVVKDDEKERFSQMLKTTEREIVHG